MPISNPIKVNANVNVEGETLFRVLANDSVIQQNDLDQEFFNLPELLAWWLTAVELQKDAVAKQKITVERLMAIVDYETREQAKRTNESLNAMVKEKKISEKEVNLIKLTEKMVENTVITDSRVQKEKDVLLEMSKNLGLLEVGKIALLAKKDMLVSIGANYRAEGNSNPLIMQQSAKERARKIQEQREKTAPQTRRPIGKKV